MGMRISYNARAGDNYRKPISVDLKEFLEGNFEVEFRLLCDRIGVSRELFAKCSYADLTSLSEQKLQSKGLSELQVGTLMGKIKKEQLMCNNKAVGGRMRDLLISMLRREDALRLSDEVQARYAQKPDDWDWKWTVTGDVQRQVCVEFGFSDSMAEGLDLLRSSMFLFPQDDEVKSAAHYLRYNLHTSYPSWMISKVTPDVKLHTMDGGETSLDAVVTARKATVIVAGSHT